MAYEELVEYLKRVEPTHSRLESTQHELNTLKEAIRHMDCIETNDDDAIENNYADEYDALSDQQILRRCKGCHFIDVQLYMF